MYNYWDDGETQREEKFAVWYYLDIIIFALYSLYENVTL